jgi:hypothetical protein
MTVLSTVVPTPAALIRLMPAGTPVYAFVDTPTVVPPSAVLARPALPGVTRQDAGGPTDARLDPAVRRYGRRPHHGVMTVGAVQTFNQGVCVVLPESHRAASAFGRWR